jgi:hypothetical protein
MESNKNIDDIDDINGKTLVALHSSRGDDKTGIVEYIFLGFVAFVFFLGLVTLLFLPTLLRAICCGCNL